MQRSEEPRPIVPNIEFDDDRLQNPPSPKHAKQTTTHLANGAESSQVNGSSPSRPKRTLPTKRSDGSSVFSLNDKKVIVRLPSPSPSKKQINLPQRPKGNDGISFGLSSNDKSASTFNTPTSSAPPGSTFRVDEWTSRNGLFSLPGYVRTGSTPLFDQPSIRASSEDLSASRGESNSTGDNSATRAVSEEPSTDTTKQAKQPSRLFGVNLQGAATLFPTTTVDAGNPPYLMKDETPRGSPSLIGFQSLTAKKSFQQYSFEVISCSNSFCFTTQLSLPLSPSLSLSLSLLDEP